MIFLIGLYGKYLEVYKLVPCNARVLELGCAGGYFSEALSKEVTKILGVGVDNDAGAIATCQRRGIPVLRMDLLLEDIDNIFAGQKPFDHVLAMDILEHLVSPQELLVRLRRQLSGDTGLIVTGPNVAYWHVRWKLLCGDWNYEESGIMDRTHLRWFTYTTWRRLLEQSGFDVIADKIAESMIPKETLLRKVLPERQLERFKEILETYHHNLLLMSFYFIVSQVLSTCRWPSRCTVGIATDSDGKLAAYVLKLFARLYVEAWVGQSIGQRILLKRRNFRRDLRDKDGYTAAAIIRSFDRRPQLHAVTVGEAFGGNYPANRPMTSITARCALHHQAYRSSHGALPARRPKLPVKVNSLRARII